MPSQEIIEKYDTVKSSLENAIAVSDSIELNGEEENAELTYIKNTLKQLNDDFKSEIERLEQSSEWDKFCMAFFGETNAGKSTIIEALRIVYDEETRRDEINRQSDQIQEELSKEEMQYEELLNSLTLLNDTLSSQRSLNKKDILIGIGLTVLGIVIGFIMAFIVL